jgi:hypothetical protein
VNPFARVYNFWMGIPLQIRTPVLAALDSYWASAVNISQGLVVGFAPYAALAGWDWTPGHFLEYLSKTWFAYFFGIGLAAIRAKQAQGRAANTVQLPSGAVATLLTQPTDGTVYPTPPKGAPSP